MAVIRLRPTSPARRHVQKVVRKHLSKAKPCKKLLDVKKRTGGRNHAGRITTRHRGGGHKQHYRIIDFKRNKDGIPARVESIQYDPNRTADIALLVYRDGARHYILAPRKLNVGDELLSGADAPIKIGNTLSLRNIPLGTVVHAIELKPGKGAQLARSAGASVQLLAREGDYALLRLCSGETRKVRVECRATIGEVGNEEHNLAKLGSAGANRRRGRRPHVRGVAMNPVDHPMGGGEGRTSGGGHPCSPTGKPAKGGRTRKNKLTRLPRNALPRSR
jgi:large subunit ribosomal protein L2